MISYIVSTVRARGLCVSINTTPILKEISFEADSGSWLGLVGPNGSGKTTLLRAISGLIPYQGDLQIQDQSIKFWKTQELAKIISFVRQATPISFDFSVEELVLLGRSPHKRWLDRYSKEDVDHLRSALTLVGLDKLQNRSVLSLSGGERQRAFLAQALVQETPLLLLDEPTNHLDIHNQFEFLQVVRKLVDNGRTVIAVFHDLEQAARYADQLLVLQDGRLVASGTPTDILTTTLLADVFRMKATPELSDEGTFRIFFSAPIS